MSTAFQVELAYAKLQQLCLLKIEFANTTVSYFPNFFLKSTMSLKLQETHSFVARKIKITYFYQKTL